MAVFNDSFREEIPRIEAKAFVECIFVFPVVFHN